jgi:hypothetical protein
VTTTAPIDFRPQFFLLRRREFHARFAKTTPKLHFTAARQLLVPHNVLETTD